MKKSCFRGAKLGFAGSPGGSGKMDRLPIASGSFYPGNKEELVSVLKTLMADSPEKQKALGAISPHAGYIYSGGVMGSVFFKNRCP